MLLSRMIIRHQLVLITILTVLAVSGGIALAETNANIQKQWLEGLSLVATGEFDKGSSLINQVAAVERDNKQIQQIHTWLEAYDTIQNNRAELKQQEYEKYVQWVDEYIAKQKWYSALFWCAQAFNNASYTEDPDVFRRQPWVQKVVEGAVEAAQQYEKEREWYKAARIYLQLDTIFPKKLEYRDAFERCQDYIIIELTYDEETEWEEMVDGITREMAIEAFRQIRTKYLTKLSFKESAISALTRLLMITEVSDPPKEEANSKPKTKDGDLIKEEEVSGLPTADDGNPPAEEIGGLYKVFEKLGDPEEVEEFRARIQPWLTRIEDRDTVALEDMVEAFDRVLRINNEIQLLPRTVLIREFVIGALKPLDRFSDMLWPSDVEEFDKNTQGKFTGVGISIRKETGEPIKVVTPLANSPAYRAGIRPGDFITHIDGKPASPLTIRLAVKRITGPPGTTVTLTIKRPGQDDAFDVPLKREEVTIYTIKGYARKDNGDWDYMIDPDQRIGYVRMTNFYSDTTQELADVMKTLKRNRLRGMILDLRHNPGGLLQSAVEVTNLFLDGNKEIVSTRDQRGQQDMQMFTSEPEGAHYPQIPMIVLVNENSASASEIVAGALQAHHRALVVGERSFGKGSVQQVLDVTHGRREAFMKLTTAWYYLPNGRCLHHHDGAETWGVDPDVAVKLVPKETLKILDMRLKKDILKGRNQETLTDEDYEKVFETQPSEDDEKEKDAPDAEIDEHDPDGMILTDKDSKEDDDDEERLRKDPNDWPERDAQLDAALLLMRIRLESNHPWQLGQPQVAGTHAAATGG